MIRLSVEIWLVGTFFIVYPTNTHGLLSYSLIILHRLLEPLVVFVRSWLHRPAIYTSYLFYVFISIPAYIYIYIYASHPVMALFYPHERIGAAFLFLRADNDEHCDVSRIV
jgi:hypothetical protein